MAEGRRFESPERVQLCQVWLGSATFGEILLDFETHGTQAMASIYQRANSPFFWQRRERQDKADLDSMQN